MNDFNTASEQIFLGEHTAKIDQKGRVSIPSEFRNKSNEGLILTRVPEQPLLVAYRPSDIENPELASLLSIFSQNTNLDSTGRTIISASIRKSIGINLEGDELAIIGTGRNFHIMAQGAWNAMKPLYEKRLMDALSRPGGFWTP